MLDLELQLEKSLLALGLVDVTTDRQRKNGTTVWKFPYSSRTIAEYKSGYIRELCTCYSCYYLNSRDKIIKYWGQNGRAYEHTKPILLSSRVDRLAKLLTYAIKHRIKEGQDEGIPA